MYVTPPEAGLYYSIRSRLLTQLLQFPRSNGESERLIWDIVLHVICRRETEQGRLRVIHPRVVYSTGHSSNRRILLDQCGAFYVERRTDQSYFLVKGLAGQTSAVKVCTVVEGLGGFGLPWVCSVVIRPGLSTTTLRLFYFCGSRLRSQTTTTIR